jgi:hypothetical protein
MKLFCIKVSPTAFFTYLLGLYFFVLKLIGTKAALKMVAKLTPGGRHYWVAILE